MFSFFKKLIQSKKRETPETAFDTLSDKKRQLEDKLTRLEDIEKELQQLKGKEEK